MAENDISRKRLTHKPFIDSEELLLLIEENVEDYAMVVLDTNGRIINWNKGADRLFGYPLDAVLGEDAALIFTPEDRDSSVPEQELNTALEQGRAVDERWHLRKDGSRFWASGILTALRKDEGTLRGFVKILRDFTERKRLQDTLREERERAEAATREVEKLNALLRRAMTEVPSSDQEQLSVALRSPGHADREQRRKRFVRRLQESLASHPRARLHSRSVDGRGQSGRRI